MWLLAYVRMDVGRGFSEFLGEMRSLVIAYIGDNDAAAFVDEQANCRLADTARPAGDYGNLPVEFSHANLASTECDKLTIIALGIQDTSVSISMSICAPCGPTSGCCAVLRSPSSFPTVADTFDFKMMAHRSHG